MKGLDEILTFYNHEGRAVAYLYEGEYIYLYDGTPVAWLSDGEFIYSYSGKYLGWIQDGWVRDITGGQYSLPKTLVVALQNQLGRRVQRAEQEEHGLRGVRAKPGRHVLLEQFHGLA